MIYKTSVLLSKTKKQYKSRALLPDRCRCCSDFRPLVRTFPDTSNSASCFLLNDEKTALALTSRRCCLLTCIVVDQTSRRWDVTMWGRRVVGTSRRSRHLHALPPAALKFFQKLPFYTNCTCMYTNHQIRYPATKITYLNIK